MHAQEFSSVLKCVLLGLIVATMQVCYVSGVGFVDYCAENTFNSNSTWLQFTKEISTKEYVMTNKFKSLHCCAKGYRSIEWFKDGKAYPWPGGVSNLILYPESANQTIYSQTLTQSDAGNYSCIVSNDTHQHLHTIHLNVIDASGYTGSPLPTYEPLDQYVRVGDEARLFCEAFVGRIDLPDAHNEASWRRGDVNASFAKLHRFHETRELREENQVLGSHLVISGVRREDFGLYICSISNTWFQVAEFPIWLREKDAWEIPMADRVAYKRILLVLGVVFLAVLTLVVVYVRFSLTLRRMFKDKFAKVEVDDGKVYDVLVCYNENDAQFVIGVLVPTLESRYAYRCCVGLLSQPSDAWLNGDLRLQAEKSRRLLAVLSSSVTNDVWTCDSIGLTINALLSLHVSTVCVALQPLPRCDSSKNANGESLSHLARRANVITWDPDRRANSMFWASLCLRLPPQRSLPADSDRRCGCSGCGGGGGGSGGGGGGMKHHSNLASSNESLEVLV